MAKKAKGKHRLDRFYHLAKEQGYRSRAAFKLAQLNRQFQFLGRARACLDLCAAPGSWLQVLSKEMPAGSLIVGFDLDPIKPIKGCTTFQCDITTPRCRQLINGVAKGGLFDVVVHDGAPNVGGAWSSEAYSQSWLVLESLKLATEYLAPKGTFVTKVFRSADYTALLYAFKQLFYKVDATKPKASRNTSAEIFVVCQGYKAPGKIDQRLLDQKFLFKDVSDPAKPVDVFDPKQLMAKRHRGGYEDGVSVLYKECPAVEFVRSAKAPEMLGAYNRFVLDGPGSGAGAGDAEAAAALRDHPATTAEVRELVKDLKVLGRREFKQLLKWRLAVKREGEKREPEGAEAAASDGEGGSGDEPDEEEELLLKMQELKEAIEARQRKAKKGKDKLRRKARIRAALGSSGADTAFADEGRLFSLVKISGEGALQQVEDEEAPDEALLEYLDADSEDEGAGSGSDSEPEGVDEDAHAAKYDTMVEDYLDRMFERVQGEALSRSQKRKRARLKDDGELAGEGEVAPAEIVTWGVDDPLQDGPENELVLDLGTRPKAPSKASIASKWFDQEAFKDAEVTVALTEMQGGGGAAGAGAAGPDDDEEGGSSEEEEEEEGFADLKRRLRADGGAAAAEAEGFEVVPQDDSDSDSDSDSLDSLNTEERAETMAMGKLLLRRKSKQALLDEAYNRYNFHDEAAPEWFLEDQRTFMRPIPPVSRAEVEAEKQRMKDVNVRSSKKVAEAKARKKRRVLKSLQQAKSKAESIMANDDMSARAQAREIESLYAKARASARRKGGDDKGGSKRRNAGRQQGGGSGKPLDRRMFADKRNEQKRAKAAKGRGRKGGRGKGGRR